MGNELVLDIVVKQIILPGEQDNYMLTQLSRKIVDGKTLIFALVPEVANFSICQRFLYNRSVDLRALAAFITGLPYHPKTIGYDIISDRPFKYLEGERIKARVKQLTIEPYGIKLDYYALIESITIKTVEGMKVDYDAHEE